MAQTPAAKHNRPKTEQGGSPLLADLGKVWMNQKPFGRFGALAYWKYGKCLKPISAAISLFYILSAISVRVSDANSFL